MKQTKSHLLRDEEIRKIISKSGLDLLLSSFLLNIRKKKDIIIVCPVGEIEELKIFSKYLKDSGISELADLIFVYKKGLDFVTLNKIDALHIKERRPLGTSGAFFTAAYLGYLLGYDVIVVADINVFIDSKKSFVECMELAKKENKAIFPICTSPLDANPTEAASYNVNGFAFYPRKVFETVGFHTLYTWRGGEDFEFLMRLAKAGLISINKKAHISHPRAGYTIFHKMAEKKKFYPYVAGLMKAFLFHSEHDFTAAIRFLAWYLFYSFFADTFSDNELVKTLKKSSDFLAFYPANQKKEIEIKKVKNKGIYPHSSSLRFILTPLLLTSLLISKRALIYTDEIVLRTSRINLLLGLIKATILIPWRILQAFSSLFSGIKTSKKLIYPVKPENAKEAIKIFAKLIESSNLTSV